MKIKEKIKFFAFGFFVTLIGLFFIYNMIKVDLSQEKYSGDLRTPLYYVDNSAENGINISFFGDNIFLEYKIINNITKYMADACRLIPAKYRLFMIFIDLIIKSIF